MKAVLIAALFAVNAVTVEGSAEGEHPMAKIIAMLKELQVKAREEGEAEAVLFQKFTYWCKNSKKELSGAIKAEKAKIEILEDEIESKTKLKETLEKEIAELEKELEESEAAGAKADKIRDDTKAEYEQAESDFKDTIAAIEECITALEDTKGEVDSLLAQRSVRKVLALAETMLPDNERGVITAFLQGVQQPTKPKAKVYSFKSQGVIELLKKLKEKFETDQLDATKAETNALNAYNLAKQAREEALEAAQKSKDEKEKIKGQAEEDLVAAEEDLTETKDDLAKNEESLETVTADCQTKADEYKARSEAQAAELVAMDMAIKILAKVAGVRPPKSEELVQAGAALQAGAPSFIQIEDPKAKAVKILIATAQKHNSKALRRLAQQITAHLAGPFDSINQMIQKMIFRLMAEQKDEDDHKNWCDMELEKSVNSRDDKADKKEELTDKLNEAKATVQELTEEVVTLNEEISGIVAAIKEATATREADKAENAAVVKDAKDAQEAIANAISVLDEFYKSQGAFVQMGAS